MEIPNKLENHESTGNGDTGNPGYLTCEPEELPSYVSSLVEKWRSEGRMPGVGDHDLEDIRSLGVLALLEEREREVENHPAASALVGQALIRFHQESSTQHLPLSHVKNMINFLAAIEKGSNGDEYAIEEFMYDLPESIGISFNTVGETGEINTNTDSLSLKQYLETLLNSSAKSVTELPESYPDSELIIGPRNSAGYFSPRPMVDVAYEKQERDERLARAIDELLDEREAEVIRLRWGFGTDKEPRLPLDKVGGKPLTLDFVSKRLGITEERARQIQNKALAKLKHTLNPEDYI